MSVDPTQISFPEVLTALLDDENIFKPTYLYRLSNLVEEELQELAGTWNEISVIRRRALLSDLYEFADADPLLFYEKIGWLALKDGDPQVRTNAIQLITLEEPQPFCETLIDLVESDDDPLVRAAAAQALGHYMYLGELEEIPAGLYRSATETLLVVCKGNDNPQVRQRALEAISYSAHPEVNGLIEDAHTSGDEDWLISALTAMGRSANMQWQPEVLFALESDETAVLLSAVQAAGNLGLLDAVARFVEILNTQDDPKIWRAVVWSLAQVGGNDASEILDALLEASEDEEEIEYIEEAMEHVTYLDDLEDLSLFNIGEIDPEELNVINPPDTDD